MKSSNIPEFSKSKNNRRLVRTYLAQEHWQFYYPLSRKTKQVYNGPRIVKFIQAILSVCQSLLKHMHQTDPTCKHAKTWKKFKYLVKTTIFNY